MEKLILKGGRRSLLSEDLNRNVASSSLYTVSSHEHITGCNEEDEDDNSRKNQQFEIGEAILSLSLSSTPSGT